MTQSRSVVLLKRERFFFVELCELCVHISPSCGGAGQCGESCRLATVKRIDCVHWNTHTHAWGLPHGAGHRRHRHCHRCWMRCWHRTHRHRSVPCLPVSIYWISWKESRGMVRLPSSSGNLLSTSHQVEVAVVDGREVACPRACHRLCALILTMT